MSQLLASENTTGTMAEEACHFPKLQEGMYDPNSIMCDNRFESIDIDLHQCTPEELTRFCAINHTNLATIFQTAWAIVLGCYSGLEYCAFGGTEFLHEGYKSYLVQVQLHDELLIKAVLEAISSCSAEAFAKSSLVNGASSNQGNGLTNNIACNSDVEFIDRRGKNGLSRSIQRETISGWTKKVLVSLHLQKLILIICQRHVGICVDASEPEFAVSLKYCESLISKEHAVRIASTYALAISVVVKQSDRMIGDIELVTNSDRAEILLWNRDQPEVLIDCVHNVIERRVASTPEALAIASTEGEFTYADLNQLSDTLALLLKQEGISAETIVPLCFEKSAWAIVAMLAVIKAGGAVSILDPTHPAARIEEICAQIGTRIVITSPRCASLPAFLNLKVISVSRELVDSLPKQTETCTSQVGPSNILYVIFTSGSTGNPKGCVIEHGAFCTAAIHHIKKASVEPNSRVFQLTPYTFDVSIFEIMTTLMIGACICIPSDLSLSKGIANAMNELRITWSFLTPSLVKLIQPIEVPLLKTLILGGEPLSKMEIEMWAEHVELGNAYGPTECCVAAAGNAKVSATTDPANIGRAIGGICWIVNADDHHRLVPIGAVGELLIEGPILAREYLNDPEKTSHSFIENPRWTLADANTCRRFYKTGDLARYNCDGTIHFIGRKDNQVKLRGQRLELGEIEHHLSLHDQVWHALVILPKSGYIRGRLTAVVSPKQEIGNTVPLNIIFESMTELSAKIPLLKSYLSSLVPTYMVPTAWILVEEIPLTTSGKLDRVRVSKWIGELSQATSRQLLQLDGEVEVQPTDSNEQFLQASCARVLNIPIEQVAMNQSFIRQGGDSISAMKLMTSCRSEGKTISLRNILQSRSLADLSLSMRQDKILNEEMFDEDFELPPTQRILLEMSQKDPTKYSRHALLQLPEKVPSNALSAAMQVLVSNHPMLRARFKATENGSWLQNIPSMVGGSFKFDVHQLDAVEKADPVGAASQSALNIITGPVFAVDSIDTQDGNQFLLLTAHDLVADSISWDIILHDLQELLQGREIELAPIPFSNWIARQEGQVKPWVATISPQPFEIPLPDYNYWAIGLDRDLDRDARYTTTSIALTKENTALLLGEKIHIALRTKPVDVLMSALSYSFIQTFPDRKPATIFGKDDSRLPWEDNDLSRTVGCFTTLYPFHVDGPRSLLDFVRHAKEARRYPRVNQNLHWADHNLSDGEKAAFGVDKNLEICFAYLEPERPSKYQIRMEYPVKRNRRASLLALIDITAQLMNETLLITFTYDQQLRYQDRITNWIKACSTSLQEISAELLSARVEYTLSDFPNLSMTSEFLQDYVARNLSDVGLSNLEEVEEIYPCTPMQEGLLLSQMRQPGLYEPHVLVEVLQPFKISISVDKLKRAWTRVVNNNTTLRTVFVESVDSRRVYDQAVLKHVAPEICHIRCSMDQVTQRHNHKAALFQRTSPPHRLTIFETETKIFCKLEVSHAIIDGGSFASILYQFTLAYNSCLYGSTSPYNSYVRYLQQLPKAESLDFWKKNLHGIEPCHLLLPVTPTEVHTLDNFESTLGFSLNTLSAFCKSESVMVSTLFQTAWALILQAYTNSDDVCFGYLSSGRDAPIRDIENAVGVYFTITPRRFNIARASPVRKTLQQAQDDNTNSLGHQHCPLIDIQHELGLSGRPLFNTLISFQKDTLPHRPQDALSVQIVHEHDPTEVGLEIASTRNAITDTSIVRPGACD